MPLPGSPIIAAPAGPTAFAVPGDITTVTGGYLYDRHLLAELTRAGRDMVLIRLPDGFPFPTPADMTRACAMLRDLPPSAPVLIDGLAYGALPTAEVARIAAPIVALVHHPLAYESGMAAADQQRLWQTERDNLRHAAAVLVPSPHTAAVLVDRYDVPAALIHVARPGVSPLARPATRASRTGADLPLILSVGILHPRKGHDVLIAALAHIADLPWRAAIVGSPWEPGHQAVLQAQIDAAGLSDRIALLGRVSDDALAGLYSQASLFALATRYEGYGMVFNEALLHGLPILSCATGAVPDTVPPDAGLLAPVGDAEGFAALLRQVLSDPDRHAALSAAAHRAGAQLTGWADTARIAGQALDAAMRARAGRGA